jgi:hypothetical protein
MTEMEGKENLIVTPRECKHERTRENQKLDLVHASMKDSCSRGNPISDVCVLLSHIC